MNIQNIREMYDYNYWANYLLLNCAEQLTPEQLIAPSTHSFSSIHGTFLHTLNAEWHWRLRLQGLEMQPDLKPEDFPTVDAIRQYWQAEEQNMRRYLDSLRDEDLEGTIRYPINEGGWRERVLWHCLYHVVNHGTQHRSEIAALLTTYHQSPGNIDFTRFLSER